MAFPKWLTPAGNLGVVPELEYYQFSFDAYDENLFAFTGNLRTGSTIISGVSSLDALVLGQTVTGLGVPSGATILNINRSGNLVTLSANSSVTGTETLSTVPLRYDRISGVLPEGIQLTPAGKLVGIPISTPTVGSDYNLMYAFTIRATNVYTGNIVDRTFNLTITNVAPPIITPKTIVDDIRITLSSTITANIGEYITQQTTGANAEVISGSVNTTSVIVNYKQNSPAFATGSGNLRVLTSGAIVSTSAYPVSTLAVSTKNYRNLGTYFDGAIIDLQLEAIEFANSAVLTWSLKDGVIPDGITLDTEGLLSGYIKPIVGVDPSSTPGWSTTPWDEVYTIDGVTRALGWDFTLGATSKTFTFTIQVTDGVNYDLCTYSLLVYPRHYFTADTSIITADLTIVDLLKLTVDTGSRHDPIILSTSIPTQREGGTFSYKIDAIDLDSDVLKYSVTSLTTGAFDEQSFAAPSDSISYIAGTLTSGQLSTGIYPKTSIVNSSILDLKPGSLVTANVGQYLSQPASGANALVTGNVVSSGSIPITMISAEYFTTSTGNLALDGVELVKASYISGTWSNVGIVPAAMITTPAIVVDYTTPELFTGDQIQFLQEDSTGIYNWHRGSVSNETTVKLVGNAKVTGSVGQFLTQAASGANATISSIGSTIGTITVGGNTTVGTMLIGGGIIIRANIGDLLTQSGSPGNATISANLTYSDNVSLIFNDGAFTIGSGNLLINGLDSNVFPVSTTTGLSPQIIKANIGDIISQPITGATATVTHAQPGGLSVVATINSGQFQFGVGNLAVNGGNVLVYPTGLTTSTNITATYTSSVPFKFATNTAAGFGYINDSNTHAIFDSVISVGVTAGAVNTQGTVGYDAGRFDQGALSLPVGLSIDPDSGWITGTLPSQTINQVTYDFNVMVYKRDYAGYEVDRQYKLTVLGDLNNTIDWLTPSNLGSIENGDISDLFVKAVSSKGKSLYYELTPGAYLRLPQGLQLLSSGIISGRVSFEVFSLDQGQTSIDGGTTTFDNTYVFSVTASDFNRTISATKEFSVRVLQRNIIPYEDLYLKALLSREQRAQYLSITEDREVFPDNLIYRSEDPYYGVAKDIKTLFLPGLTPSQVSDYVDAVSTNHFTKRILFGSVKTAIAVDNSYDVIETGTGNVIGTFQDNVGFIPLNFDLGYSVSATLPADTELGNEHIKYEVVYLEVLDENSTSLGHGPADVINLSNEISNPYYDANSNSYTIAYPNSFENMGNIVAKTIGFDNKGALPDWMTSKQTDGRVLGFTRAVVLAYTKAGASNTIAYRYSQAGYNLNELDFTVDRYQLDNNYSANFDLDTNKFIHSRETTFDKYPTLSSVFTPVGTVDYAVTTSFESINNRTVDAIIADGGLDGIKTFQHGDTLVFFNQEFRSDAGVGDQYNLGWSDTIAPWDFKSIEPWDQAAWDASGYVPGYNEHLLNPSIENQRIGIWQISIDNNLVNLEFVQTVNYYEKVFVRNGFSNGSTNIYYDPVVKVNNVVPNYSIIPQQINTNSTRFDGGGTKFLSYRDIYSVPEQGDKYIKFAKTGVFT